MPKTVAQPKGKGKEVGGSSVEWALCVSGGISGCGWGEDSVSGI